MEVKCKIDLVWIESNRSWIIPSKFTDCFDIWSGKHSVIVTGIDGKMYNLTDSFIKASSMKEVLKLHITQEGEKGRAIGVCELIGEDLCTVDSFFNRLSLIVTKVITK